MTDQTIIPTAPQPIREVSVDDALRLAADGYRIIDVREPLEWNGGHIPGATLIPLGDVVERIEAAIPDRSTPLLVHCAAGARSGRAVARIQALGYTNAVSMRGTTGEWRRLGGAWEAPEPLLTPEQQRRYSRQLLIPEIGQKGQRRLLDAKVLIIGAGGLGSPAALYLAASGIGTIGLVDDDVVDESNLQRQVLHTADRVGVPKTESARMTLNALNPQTTIVEHRERLSGDNVERLIARYDVIVDGTDNFDTRYVLNDAAVKLRKPVVHGSIYRWDGQVTSFVPFAGPCYRCMYPTQPPEELAPSCAVAGVLGVLPGIVGLLQADEVFKLLLGVGETLAGRLLMFDAMTTTFDEVKVWRDPECPACGEHSPYLEAAAPAAQATVAAR
ncbi:MAG TPA: molybdopterin-synthase adenylyltransferase MoeB [Candidatus Limnocylindria bacterium]|nr:molybdopterin-synthase adenylyltransferase MoeB [Candidatus Limnocylindria bacterium]